jgi:hypothetical protein
MHRGRRVASRDQRLISVVELTNAEPTAIQHSSKFDIVINLNNSAIMLVTCDTASTPLRGEEVIE